MNRESIFIPFFAVLTLLACSKKETNGYDSISLFGSWKEYEAYADPGDGSGTFHNNILELRYICIEGCGSRFKKVSTDSRLGN